MKKHYPWLWFDADGTLFDFKRAEAAAFKNTFDLLNLPYQDDYLDVYHRINHDLWQALEKQEITPPVLQVRRFELLLESVQLTAPIPVISTTYLEQLAVCSELMDDAYEVLRSLHGKSRIAIVTNGLKLVQRSRLEHSVIRDFITDIIISEEIGVAKPDSAYFEIASSRLGNPPKSDILIIGDSLTSDMQGGVNYGIDTCWFNPANEARPVHLPITYTISTLRELLDILV